MRIWVCVDETQVEIETDNKYSPDICDDLIRRATETIMNIYAGVATIDEQMHLVANPEDEDDDELAETESDEE
jgi:hypothetical protein